MTEIQDKVQQIREYSRQLVRELDVLKGVFKDTGFSYSQCHVLFELDKHKLLNQGELSALLCLDKSTTSRVVKGMIDKGLVKYVLNGSDKRQKMLSLTEGGVEAVNRNNCLASDQVADALKLMDLEEVEQTLYGLKNYAKALTRSRRQQDFHFRLIKKEDNEKVARLIREVMTEYQAVGEGYSIQDSEVDHMFDAYNNAQSAFWVLELDGKIVGAGGIGPLKGGEKDICELKKMYFYPEARGLGLGKKLVQSCLDKAKEIGYKKVYLETLERMWQANLLYKKMGFVPLQTACGDTGHGSCDTYYVREVG